jgi:Transposase DDE domain.
MGIGTAVARSTLADANEARDWRIYFELAQRLIIKARALYVDEDFGVELANTVYALDATTIDLCLSMFPWAPFRSTKAAVKLHTLLDLRGSIPTFIHISDGKMHDVNVLDLLLIEAGAFYIMDRGYLDFERLYALDQAGRLLHHARQAKPRCTARVLGAGGSRHGTHLRPDHRP